MKISWSVVVAVASGDTSSKIAAEESSIVGSHSIVVWYSNWVRRISASPGNVRLTPGRGLLATA